MENVLVSGGFGFVGSHTVDELINSGYNVTVLDNLERQVHQGKVPEYKNKNAIYIKGDIRYKKHWKKALTDVDYIIHLAGAVGTGQSFWQPSKYLSINTIGTAILYEILVNDSEIRNRIKKIVVASSKSINGEGAYRCQTHGIKFPETRNINDLSLHKWEPICPECENQMTHFPLTETKPVQNPNPYSLGKYTTEVISLQYSKVLRIPTVAFRYFNVYGPRQSLNNPYTGVLAIFLSRLKNGNQPTLFEDGGQLRDYVYVKDVANLNVAALKKGSGVYNLGTGKPTSLLDIVRLLNNGLGFDIPPKILGEFRPGDNRHDYADTTKLVRDFGPVKFTNLSDGIEELIEWSKDVNATDNFEKQEKERKKYIPSYNFSEDRYVQ